MIKLIASDLDNTMVPEGTFDLNPEYYDVIRRLKEKGIRFVAASGRHYSSIVKIMDPVKDDILFLAGNGSCIIREGKPVSYTKIPAGLYRSVLQEARRYCPQIILTDRPESVYTDSDNEDMVRWVKDGYRVRLTRCKDLAGVEEPILKSALFVSSDAASYVEKLLASGYGERLDVMTAGDHWVDIVARGADKGSALETVQRLLGISREETIAFGDNGNDISMLKRAGNSYAVENARVEVKDAADEVIGPIREDAVLKILKKLL